MDDKKKKKDKALALVIIAVLIVLTVTWLVADYLGSKPKEPIPVIDDTPIINNSETVISDTEYEEEVSSETELYGEPSHFEYGELHNFVTEDTMKLIVEAVPEEKLSLLSTGISYTMLDEKLTFVKYTTDCLVLEDSQYTYTVFIEDGGLAVSIVKK